MEHLTLDPNVKKNLKVKVLFSLKDLLTQCEQQQILVSDETNKYLKCLIIDRLGIRKTQQLMKKCKKLSCCYLILLLYDNSRNYFN